MYQPTEKPDQLFVIIIDETYDHSTDWEADSERYRQGLERDFKTGFQTVDIGSGADLPAFLTNLANATVPLWSATLAVFFLGKQIKENLDAWGEMVRAIKRFFPRPVVLARNGAAVLAIQAVFDQMDGIPKSVRLLRYRSGNIFEDDAFDRHWRGTEIEDSPPTQTLDRIIHLFEIEADGLLYRVEVRDMKTKIARIDPDRES